MYAALLDFCYKGAAVRSSPEPTPVPVICSDEARTSLLQLWYSSQFYAGGWVQMKRFGKWLLIALGSLAALLAIAITLTIGWRPFLGPRARLLTNRTFEPTPQPLQPCHYIPTAL